MGDDPEKLLERLMEWKEKATKLYRLGDYELGSGMLRQVSFDIVRFKRARAFPRLVSSGGQPFVDNIAELIFITSLNAAHLDIIAHGGEATSPYVSIETRRSIIEHLLKAAKTCIKPGYWESDSIWKPTNVQLAKLHFRRATYLMLCEGISRSRSVLMHMKRALGYALNDSVLLEAQKNVVRWAGSEGR